MKIKITFDTSDPDQRLEHEQVMKAVPALGALYDIYTLIGRMRHDALNSNHSEDEKELIDEQLCNFLEGYNSILEKRGINLEELYP